MDNSSANIDLIRSHVDIIILKPLESRDRYGYEILKEIETNSNGLYSLKQPTMYSCLKRLEKQGYINSYLGDESNGAQRRYYSLTQQGREFLESQQSQWEFVRTILSGLVSNEDFDKEKDVQPFDPSKYRPLTKRTRSEDDEETPAKVVEKVVYVPVESEQKELTKDEIKEKLTSDDIDEIVKEYLETNGMKLADKDATLLDSDVDATNDDSDIDSSIFDSYFNDYDTEEPPTSDIEAFVQESNIEKKPFEEEDIPAVPIESYENESILNELTIPQNNYVDPILPADEDVAQYARHEVSEDDLIETKPQIKVYKQPTPEVKDVQEVETDTRYEAFNNVPQKYDVNDDSESLFDYSHTMSAVEDVKKTDEPVNVFKALDRIYSVTNTDEEEDVNVEDYEESHSRARYNTTTELHNKIETISELKAKLEDEGIKIRPYTKINSSEFYINNYYYANRTARDTSLIMFAIFFIESLLAHFILTTTFELNIGYLVLTWGVAALVPIFFTIKWAITPYYKKPTRFSLKLSLMLGLIALLNAALIIFLAGFFGFGADYTDANTMILPIVTPLIFLLNIPLYSIVYYILYKSKRYNLR